MAAWISRYIRYKVWDWIIYPFPNFHGKTLEKWDFTGYVIIYPCYD